MKAKIRPRVTFANVTSLVALFVALSGGAYAATQLPANSVGTKQLKKNAVTSAKIKDGAIVGADINKSKLGKVPLASKADAAGNAAKLGGLNPNAFLRSNGKAVDAAHADSADNAGNANTVGGKASSDFVGATDQAGGALQGPFSGLSLRPNAVTSGHVADESLTNADIGDFKHVSKLLADGNSGDNAPVTTQLDAVAGDGMVFTAKCNNTGGGAMTATVTVTGTVNGSHFDSDSDAPNGDRNQGAVAAGTEKRLVEIGPTATRSVSSGSWSVVDAGGNALSGIVVANIRQGSTCNFGFTRFGS